MLGGDRRSAADSQDGRPRRSGAASEFVRFAEAHVSRKREAPRGKPCDYLGGSTTLQSCESETRRQSQVWRPVLRGRGQAGQARGLHK
jgi:hypothetical protein